MKNFQRICGSLELELWIIKPYYRVYRDLAILSEKVKIYKGYLIKMWVWGGGEPSPTSSTILKRMSKL